MGCGRAVNTGCRGAISATLAGVQGLGKVRGHPNRDGLAETSESCADWGSRQGPFSGLLELAPLGRRVDPGHRTPGRHMLCGQLARRVAKGGRTGTDSARCLSVS
jgi:hypothetical protein